LATGEFRIEKKLYQLFADWSKNYVHCGEAGGQGTSVEEECAGLQRVEDGVGALLGAIGGGRDRLQGPGF
jgi:hypothetical protein